MGGFVERIEGVKRREEKTEENREEKTEEKREEKTEEKRR